MFHPLIRVICFLVLAIGLAWGNAWALLVGTLWLMVIWQKIGLPSADVLCFIRRLRWLFVSIALIYLLTIPGEPITTLSELPTFEGVWFSLHRIVILILMVLAVEALVLRVEQDDLVQSIYYLLSPLKILNIDIDHWVLRIVLTLQLLNDGRHLMPHNDVTQATTLRQRLNNIVEAISERITTLNDNTPVMDVIEVEFAALPNYLSWIFPMLIGISFVVFT